MNTARKTSPELNDPQTNISKRPDVVLSVTKNKPDLVLKKVVSNQKITSDEVKNRTTKIIAKPKKIEDHKDELCITHEDIEKTINVFLSAIENLMNRKNGDYKLLKLDDQKNKLITQVGKSKKEFKSSTLKQVSHSIVSHSYPKVPSIEECLAEETELKLIQYRRTQEEQRAIEKSAIKAKYLAENLDIPVNNLKYMKHLFYDLTRKKIAPRFSKFSQSLARQSENIDKEGVYIRETELKKEEIDSKIKRVLVEESDILKQINIEYPFYIRNLFQKFPHIFDRKPKISFHELFADKVSLPYRLTVKVETPIKEKSDDTQQDKKEIKTKTEYKVVKVDIKLRESVRLKFMNKTTVLNRKALNDFMAENVESSDLFWMLHIAIHKVIQQELNIIKQEQRDKSDEKKKK